MLNADLPFVLYIPSYSEAAQVVLDVSQRCQDALALAINSGFLAYRTVDCSVPGAYMSDMIYFRDS